jgi:hypothetical protein
MRRTGVATRSPALIPCTGSSSARGRRRASNDRVVPNVRGLIGRLGPCVEYLPDRVTGDSPLRRKATAPSYTLTELPPGYRGLRRRPRSRVSGDCRQDLRATCAPFMPPGHTG